MAQHVGTDHNEIVIGQKEVCEFLPELVRYTDEPLADLASIPLYYVSRLALEKVKVVLSGEGSDEILAGYDFDRFVKDVDRRRAWQRLPRWLRSEAGTAILRRLLGAGFEQRFHMDDTPLDLRCHPVPPHMTNYLASDEKRPMLLVDDDFGDSMDIVREAIARVPGAGPLHQMLYTYCQSWLVEDLLMKADRMSMANSLELRTPFLDYRLVEWAARAPVRAKVAINAAGKYETKYILRRFAEKRLPPEIISRPKMGFPVPLYDWLPNRLKSWAEDLLLPSDAHIYRWFKRDSVQNQLRLGTDMRGTLPDRHRLWNLLIFELWCRAWKPA
jgi:asparagine synthase (glutamine-hydrolysing)